MSRHVDILIIGGGSAGLAAARGAYDAGARDILVLERNGVLGGILNQCIHNGFGLMRFKEELTGPEYAARDIALVREAGIETMCDTMVLSLDANRHVVAANAHEGIFECDANAIVLAMGCRERTRGALNIAGTRPAGVYTAGTAQYLINIKGQLPGRDVVILGSGDIGLIVARRLVYEGVRVQAVYNRSGKSSGLARNIVQCLDDYDIPLKLLHTVTTIYGHDRLCGVGVSSVDPQTKLAVPDTEVYVPCDTLLLAIGLVPENELSRQAGIVIDAKTKGPVVDKTLQTSVEGIFAAGNVLHVHDVVDRVSREAERAGRNAAHFVAERGE